MPGPNPRGGTGADLPEGWFTPIRRTSCRPSQIILGVPMEVLGLALWLAAELALALDAWPQGLLAFLALWLPARYLTRQDPWWLEIVRQGVGSWLWRRRSLSARRSTYRRVG